MDLKEKAAALQAKRDELAKLFMDSKDKETGSLKLTPAQIVEVNQREDELKTMQADYDTDRGLAEIEAKNNEQLAALREPINPLPFAGKGANPSERFLEAKSLGQLFVDSKSYKERGSRKVSDIAFEDIDVKTAMFTSSNGYPPQVLRSGVLIYSPQAQPTLIDLLPQTDTDQNGYKYMLETVFTNTAAETAEGSLGPEAALTYAEQLSPVRKIPVFIPITEEELADVKGIRDIVDSRLILMIKQRLNSQVVVGDGTGANLTGITNVVGVLSQAKGADNTPDAIYKAMIKIMTVGFADPSGVWMNPVDWQNVRLLKTSTGQYLYGDPSLPGPNTIFGLPVAMHVNVALGTSVVADFQTYTKLVYRNGIEISVSDSHSDFFVRGQLAIRAMLRAAFVVYRPQAVCLATGL